MNTAFRGGLGPKPERTACHQNKSTRRRAELYSFPGVTLGSVAAIAADVEPLKSLCRPDLEWWAVQGSNL